MTFQKWMQEVNEICLSTYLMSIYDLPCPAPFLRTIHNLTLSHDSLVVAGSERREGVARPELRTCAANSDGVRYPIAEFGRSSL